MTIMKGKNRYPLDLAPQITFKAYGSVAVTADETSAILSLDPLMGYWNNPALPADEQFAIVIDVTAVDRTTGDETYKFTVETDELVAFASAIASQSITVTAAGQYVLLVDVGTLLLFDPLAKVIRLNLDVSGTTPIISYNARIMPIIGRG